MSGDYVNLKTRDFVVGQGAAKAANCGYSTNILAVSNDINTGNGKFRNTKMSTMDWNQSGDSSLSSQLGQLTVEETGERMRQNLLEKCNLLLSELEEFEQFLLKKKDTGVELRHFKSSVKTELSLIQKVCASY